MTRNIYIIIFTFLLFSCSENNPIGYVGQPVSTTIDLPDESEDLEFLWELTSIPTKSFLINTDIQAGNDNYSVMFIPDVVGVYSIEVSIFQYNDEIETQSFTYNISESLDIDTSSISILNQVALDTLALNELLASDNIENNWYDSDMVNEYISSTAQDTLSISQEEPKKQKTIPLSPSKRKILNKKPTKGELIPFDKNRFTIQIASKKKLADAKKVAGKLIEAGYDAYIQRADFKESNEIWFRIRVGSYDNRQTASAVAESLSESQKETAWVDFVRYEN